MRDIFYKSANFTGDWWVISTSTACLAFLAVSAMGAKPEFLQVFPIAIGTSLPIAILRSNMRKQQGSISAESAAACNTAKSPF